MRKKNLVIQVSEFFHGHNKLKCIHTKSKAPTVPVAPKPPQHTSTYLNPTLPRPPDGAPLMEPALAADALNQRIRIGAAQEALQPRLRRRPPTPEPNRGRSERA